jgi:predicted metal-binding protein
MKRNARHAKYAKTAKDMGALDAVVIRAGDVVVDARALLKCQFGCKDYWVNWTCPSVPGALRPWEFEKILRRYRWALLVHCAEKKISQKISYEIERRAFADGHYFAFSFSDCGVCGKCARPGGLCRNRKMARPAMQGVGIDVFATARRQGLPIKTLKDLNDTQNWYSLVLIE